MIWVFIVEFSRWSNGGYLWRAKNEDYNQHGTSDQNVKIPGTGSTQTHIMFGYFAQGVRCVVVELVHHRNISHTQGCALLIADAFNDTNKPMILQYQIMTIW